MAAAKKKNLPRPKRMKNIAADITTVSARLWGRAIIGVVCEGLPAHTKLTRAKRLEISLKAFEMGYEAAQFDQKMQATSKRRSGKR